VKYPAGRKITEHTDQQTTIKQWRRGAFVLAMATTSVTTRLPAQEPVRLSLPDGRSLEVIGLRRWSLQMVQDSLAKYSPHDSLQSHACAAILRYKLLFADAASAMYVGETGPMRIVVSLREPQDSARVHYRSVPLDSANPRPVWRVATAVMHDRPDIFWPAIQSYLSGSKQPAPQWRSAGDSAVAATLIVFLRARKSNVDWADAITVLNQSPNMYDRAIATLILANFSERDQTWWALVETLRESDGLAKGVASQVLLALTRNHPKKVEWATVANGINAILDGTSLFMLPILAQVLVGTGVTPADAQLFLRDGGDMLVRYLKSSEPYLVSNAHALLVQLRGADLGLEPDPWRRWIVSL
jgi:hypothetical protein